MINSNVLKSLFQSLFSESVTSLSDGNHYHRCGNSNVIYKCSISHCGSEFKESLELVSDVTIKQLGL